MLFKGPQLGHHNATFDYVHFVNVEQAKQVARKVLYNYEETHLQFILKKIKEKGKQKGGKQSEIFVVDSAFVLRLFLEYYRMERILKLKTLRQIFLSEPQEEVRNQLSVSFQSFARIMQINFPFTSDSQRCQLFRDCWNANLGVVNADTFFTVASDQGYSLFIDL